MTPTAASYRTLTDLDHVRLANLLRRQAGAGSALAELIDNADQVPPQAIAPDVVTMHTRLRVSDTAQGPQRAITLCYPAEADAAQGMISVLSPLGTALLGLRVGDVAHWQGAGGQPGQLYLRGIDYQPEASGDYTT